jgi:hypothetical protein
MDTDTDRETCGYPDCVFCYPLVTGTGRILTQDELDQLVEEAAAGYDLSRIRAVRCL